MSRGPCKKEFNLIFFEGISSYFTEINSQKKKDGITFFCFFPPVSTCQFMMTLHKLQLPSILSYILIWQFPLNGLTEVAIHAVSLCGNPVFWLFSHPFFWPSIYTLLSGLPSCCYLVCQGATEKVWEKLCKILASSWGLDVLMIWSMRMMFVEPDMPANLFISWLCI